MEKEILCELQLVNSKDTETEGVNAEKLSLTRQEMAVIVSKESYGSELLQILAGLRSGNGEKVLLPDKALCIQYVPDDIICYDSLTVEQFLKRASDQEAALVLCEKFGIVPTEQLLELTFEQNRIVAMIQAIVKKPDLLLLDHPHDMISENGYRMLIEEIVRLKKEGTTVVMAVSSYKEVEVCCDTYHFMKEKCLYRSVPAAELPKTAKVVTLHSNKTSEELLCGSNQRLLWEKETDKVFLCRDMEVSALLQWIADSECSDFTVHDISMEEDICEEFGRWKP